MTALDVYERTIKPLPPSKRLQLASLILNDLAGDHRSIDEDGEWSAEDLADVTRATWTHIDQQLGDGDAPIR